MNYLTFHNRYKLVKDYRYSLNNYRCLMCSYQYHPQYVKSENAFLLLDCGHLIHRQCLKSMHHVVPEDWKESCPLCIRVEAFNESASKVYQRKREREAEDSEYTFYKYEDIIARVDKTGKYSFK